MPPKKAQPQQASKKTVEKQKQKVIEDKTFGLKNKKGAKQQKFVQQVQKQVQFGNKSAREIEKAKEEKEAKKKQNKDEIEEMRQLFKPVIALQKVNADVDPKSILCAYFKQGLCTKGNKCKFSHDLNIERKSAKRNIYEQEEKEDMSSWDQQKLEEVIDKRHGVKNKGLPPTSIICKFFIDAVENSKYGWFWECPNGQNCHYRHALPPDYVLKRDQKKMQEQKIEISLEELIEKERAALGHDQTPITWESFKAWKRKKRSEKIRTEKESKELKEREFKQGKQTGLSGRELFDFNPELIQDSQGDEDGETVYVRGASGEGNGDDDEGMEGVDVPVHDIKLSDFDLDDELPSNVMNGGGAVGGAAAIDEDLFNVDDLDGLDEELEKLDVEE